MALSDLQDLREFGTPEIQFGTPETRARRTPGGFPWSFALIAALFLAFAGAPQAEAEPMDLTNRNPRWVSVRFEVSPADRPAQVDAHYAAPIRAWLEPDTLPSVLRLAIPGATVESELLSAEDPVPGTFSEFVWTFDTTTGDVLSARMEGTVVRHLDWGLAKSRMQAQLRFHMDTLRVAGFRKPGRLLGQQVNRYCEPNSRKGWCVAVDPIRYDPSTGYVNAIGRVVVESKLMTLETFSTLGEAKFSEVDPPRGGDAVPEAPIIKVEPRIPVIESPIREVQSSVYAPPERAREDQP